MTSQFPGALDNFTNPTPADSLNTPQVLHSDQHSNENDAIEAIEAWVGISGTSAQASHEYRIKQLENTPASSSTFGIVGQDEGVPLGTGTVLNVVGENVVLSRSGTVLQLTHTNPTIVFPQEVIGIYGQDEGIGLGTGTVLNVTGDNVQMSLSGTVLNIHHTNPVIAFPQEMIGIYGQDEGVGLGTGSILNVTGDDIQLSLSGTVLNIRHTNPTFPQDNIGIFGKDEGQPVGTGTIVNVVGENISLSLSGTTLTIEHTNPTITFPQSQIGIFAQDEGVGLGTGTILNVTGDNVQLSISGTVINFHHTNPASSPGGAGIVVWDEGVVVGTGTTFNFVGGNVTASISGSVVQVYVTGSSGGGITMDDADPYGIHHRLDAAHADDDEFSSDTLANYTQITHASGGGTATFSIARHALTCRFTNQSSAKFIGLVKAMTLADGEAWETYINCAAGNGNYTMFGLVVSDGTLSTSNMMLLQRIAISYHVEVYIGTFGSVSSSPVTTVYTGIPVTHMRMRLKRNSSTSFQALFSNPDGNVFEDFGIAAVNPGFTPTHAGVVVSTYGGTHESVVSWDFIRHIT